MSRSFSPRSRISGPRRVAIRGALGAARQRRRRWLGSRLRLAAALALTGAACAGPHAAPAATPAQATPAPLSPAVPLDPRVTTGTLANGLTYYLQQHETKDKRAHLMLVVKVGSVYERDDERGLAHFIEHMAFNGTRRFEKETLVDFFEKSGLTFGSHANATTAYDRTQYLLSIPTDDPALLGTALDVLEDWASGLSFGPDEVQKERPVLLSEWTSSKGAARRVGEQLRRILLAGSIHAEREVIGDEAVLTTAPRERLVEFYRRWYRPERMAVVVVGDIEPAAVQAAISERFSRIVPATGPAPALPALAVPLRPQPVSAVVADAETPATVVSVVFKTPARPVATEADQRDQLTSVMAAVMLNRRLEALSLNPVAPFAGASSGVAPSTFGCLDLVQVNARAKQGQALASLDLLLAELERVKRHGFIEAEVERTKGDLARVLDRAVEAEATTEARAIAQSLANQFVTGDVVTSAEYDQAIGKQLIADISGAELGARAAAWFEGSERLVIVSGAARDALPEAAQLDAALHAAAGKPVEPYRDEVAKAPLMAQLPAPGRIVKEEQVVEVGLSVWTLSNGARVVLKPTDFKDDQILMQASSFGGNALASAADLQSARFAPDIVLASGVGALDRQALGKALSGKVASARPFIDEQSEGISASSSPRDAETMFQLVHLYATAPRRDEAAFEALRAALRESLRNRDLSPEQTFGDAISREMWGNQPRRLPPTLADVDGIDLDRALAFYRSRLGDASDVSFVLVGDIDPVALRPLVERYLASLPGTGRKESYKDLGLRRKKGISQVRVEAGKEDKASVVIMFHGESPWSEDAHTDLVSLESYLTIRLREVLREQMGGVYTPSVSSTFERVPFDAYSLVVAFQCKSGDIEKLERATREVIAELKQKGPAPDYLTKLISQRTRSLEESYRSNDFWIARLTSKYERGENPRDILILHELTKRITSENMKRAALQFLRSEQYFQAELRPRR
jgi:zinc protease